jgi:hypothetical protein
MLLKLGIYCLYGIVSTTCSRYEEQSGHNILQVNTSKTKNLLEGNAKSKSRYMTGSHILGPSHQLYSFVVRVSKPRMVENKLFHAQKYLHDFLLLDEACTLYNELTVLR